MENSCDQGRNFTAAMTAIAVVAPRSGRYAPQMIVRPTATMAFVPLTLLKSRSCFKSVTCLIYKRCVSSKDGVRQFLSNVCDL